ncbi:MAG: EAL domain-containing protein [Gallionella sp.]
MFTPNLFKEAGAALLLKSNSSKTVLLSGSLVVLFGSVVMIGWIFGYPMLTSINSGWKPMVPATALCFMLSGLSLLAYNKLPGKSSPIAHRIYVWLILLLAGGRAVELVSGHVFGIEYLFPGMDLQFTFIGYMSSLTMGGFLAFATGMMALHRDNSRKIQILSGIMAGLLLLMGITGVIGYWLVLPLIFDGLYVNNDLIWMAFHTSIGMALLGTGLLCLALRCRQSETTTVQQQAATIYRTILLVLTATAITTGLAGISFLEQTVYKQAGTDLMHSLDAVRSHIDNSLENRTQRALVAGLNPALRADALRSLRGAAGMPSDMQQSRAATQLIAHGFTGIGAENGRRLIKIAGFLHDDRTTYSMLKDKADASITWDKKYYLRMRIPLGNSSKDFLVFEQSLPQLDLIFDQYNHWGKTGVLAMCAGLVQNVLLCYPQREQSTLYVVPDQVNGQPLPMAYALDHKTGIKSLTDYRENKVLAAYGPIANTGMGLVLRKDLSEIYAPVREELLIATPLITLLVLLGLSLIRTRIKPMVLSMATAYTAESKARASFDAAMQSSPDGFVIYQSMKDPAENIVDFRCVYLNQHAEKIAKLAAGAFSETLPEILEGHTFLKTFPGLADAYAQLRTVALTGELQIEEMSLPRNEGGALWFLRQIVPMPEGVAVTYREITKEKLLVQQLEYSTRLRTAIMESAAYAIIATDVNGTILTFNQAAERMLWYRAEDMIGKSTPLVYHDAEEIREHADALSNELGYPVEPGFEVFVAKAKQNFQEEYEWTYVRKDGSRFPVLLSVTALRDESNTIQGFLGIAYDITERKRTEDYIRHIALHDVLTGLPNRALLDDRVIVAIEQQRRSNSVFALAMMDIDRFKHINDSMGHHIGDLLLKGFVERVKSCLRPTDTLARMGGDEFVLLLSDSDEAGAAVVVERIIRELKPPINAGVQELHITASIGISVCPRDGMDINELLRCADVAMYWVKEHGRNGFKMYTREMDSGEVERLGLERDLHIALEQGGFSLHYQPKVDLKTGIIIGVEALLRLRKPDGRHISPADFIPLAEDTGLIVPIGQWALETACRDTARLQKSLGAPLTVAVNISPRQFMNGDLLSTVQAELSQSQLDPSQLELEITEGVLMDERSGVTTALFDLNHLGVKIAIDDFGTGYSSLSYLKRYPISTLKIDQSFVRDMTNDPGDAALVVAIIAMGHSLKISVVAEGVETEEQLAFLAENNCEQGQGFLIGRPMPFDTLLQWFAEEKRWKLDKGKQ